MDDLAKTPPEDEQNPTDPSIGESLESESTSSPEDNDTPGENITTGGAVLPPSSQPPEPKKHWLRNLWRRFNIYLLIFILLIIVAGIVIVVAVFKTNNKPSAADLKNQTLSEQALKDLANSDATVGDPKQVLNIQSNAVFSGSVLVRKDLDVAGTIKVGGSLALPGINVSGTSTFSQIQAKKLAISGDASINGQTTIQKGLSVNGSGAFNGAVTTPQLTTNSLQLNGNLVLNHHITAGGPIPGRSNGGALGSGGTSTLSGSDTSGSVSIHTGGGPGIGCFLTINFVQRFSSTPHVVISPVGSAAGRLDYYVTRSTSNFSICTASTPGAGQSFGFDYIVFD